VALLWIPWACVQKDPPAGAYLSRERAIDIARVDAQRVYKKPGELDEFRITATLEGDVWRVDFELRDPGTVGGGPHYGIDARSGRILSRRFQQ
jgi:hypothetical protein